MCNITTEYHSGKRMFQQSRIRFRLWEMLKQSSIEIERLSRVCRNKMYGRHDRMMMDVRFWRVSTSMRCALASFGARVPVRSVPAVRPLLTYLLTYLLYLLYVALC